MISFVLTHFDQRMGPTVYLSFPEEKLDIELKKKIERFMDLDFGNSSFEINLSENNFRTFNTMIDLPSKKSRGNTESFLFTIIMDNDYNSEIVYKFLKDANKKILSSIELTDDISKYYNKIKESLAECMNKLTNMLKKGKSDVIKENLKYLEETKVSYLSSNLQNLTRHISNKNEFDIKNFQIKDNNGRFIIQIELKGKGFLTGPLKKMTIKSVYDGVEKYMISNGILKENFEINIT